MRCTSPGTGVIGTSGRAGVKGTSDERSTLADRRVTRLFLSNTSGTILTAGGGGESFRSAYNRVYNYSKTV